MVQKKHTIVALMTLLLVSGTTYYGAIAKDYVNDSEKMDNSNDRNIGDIMADMQIDQLIIEVDDMDITLMAEILSVYEENMVNMNNVELEIDGFSGMIEVKSEIIMLKGSFIRMFNDNFNIDAMESAEIIIKNGNIESNWNNVPRISTQAIGNLNFDNAIFNLKDNQIELENFEGLVKISNFPNKLNLSGSVESLNIIDTNYEITIK
ncbi:MAG: hypothetical protein ABIC04_00870 [Nanoarchaeota archaeon]